MSHSRFTPYSVGWLSAAVIFSTPWPAESAEPGPVVPTTATPAVSATNTVPGFTDPAHGLPISSNAVVFTSPQPAVIVSGKWEGLRGQMVLLDGDHLQGKAVTHVGADRELMLANAPVDVEWDFNTGRLSITATKAILLNLSVANVETVRTESNILKGNLSQEGYLTLMLPTGTVVFDGTKPNEAVRQAIQAQLKAWVKTATEAKEKPAGPPPQKP